MQPVIVVRSPLPDFLPESAAITVTAPGKLVLWGEYAVLAGAPAGVLAVNREVQVACSTAAADGRGANWEITTAGFSGASVRVNAEWFASNQPPPVNHAGFLLWHAAKQCAWQPSQDAQLHIDSSAFYYQGQKLGFGSSAAACTALSWLCHQLAGRHPGLQDALAAHTAAQAGAGSGIDVAASCNGGLQTFQRNPAGTLHLHHLNWPSALHWQTFWTGAPASTPEHLQRFTAWQAGGRTSALDQLVAASEACAANFGLETLTPYITALRAFDQASGIGIYAQGHQKLHKLAEAVGVLYKPCGAGGGDLGVAFASNPQALQAFASRAAAEHVQPISVEMAIHGVTIRSKHY